MVGPCGGAISMMSPAPKLWIAATRPSGSSAVLPPSCAANALSLRGGFGSGLALLARHGLFRIVARGALHDTGGIEETGHAVGRLRALGEPGLDLVHVELQPRLIVLRQQRIEMPEPFDEAAVARKARVGDDDVIDRALLGACARKADND